ncbi:hypothetical protein ACFQYP_24090 [Nonomuraea antimicrobica]
MNTATKLGSYVLGLAVVFGGALGVGNAVGPIGAPASMTEDHTSMTGAAPTPAASPSASEGHGEHATTQQATEDTPGGSKCRRTATPSTRSPRRSSPASRPTSASP